MLALAALTLAAPSSGDRLKDGRPVEMSARGGLKIDLKGQTGKAKGDVLIKRDDILVCCDEADAQFDGDQIQRVECRGRVVIVRPDGTRARADVAVFDARADQVTLSGAAKLRSNETDLEGESIIYDVARDQLEVTGQKSKFRFSPGPKKPLELERACPPG